MQVQSQQQADTGVEVPITHAQPSTTSAPSQTKLQDTTPTSHATPPQYQPLTPHDSPLQDQPTTLHDSPMPLLTTLMETCATLSQKRLERKKKSKTLGLKRLRRVDADQRVKSSFDTVLGAEDDASKHGKKIAAIDANEGTTLVNAETNKEVVLDAESQRRTNLKTKVHLVKENVNAASKGVSVVIAPELVSTAEPTMFDNEDVTMIMAQTLIKLKAKGFDREDLVTLWNLVKERFSLAEPIEDKERGRRVIPFDHFINNDIEYLRGGVSSRKYTTSVTKTKAANYGHIKWIEDLVPCTMWSQVLVSYDKHALWGISHWGRKHQQFYGFAVNMESARDVYSKHRIIAVTELQIVEWYNYKHLDWIFVRRDDDKLYKFKERDFKRL
uniref:Uncharacterized protein n=1 Tax=Tanacetum cinerariifolium TaxID=118510 RepID=A0A6L2K351_TANCI|nr:hypothetical protein [Tanacetum cinerariifolium]